MRFDSATQEGERYAFVCRPNGVVQPVRIRLEGAYGREVLVYCPSASEAMIIGEPGDETALQWGGDDAS